MIEMYISIELEKVKDSMKGRSDIENNSKTRALDVKITALLSSYMSGKAAKNTIARSVTSLIESSGAFSGNVLNVINKKVIRDCYGSINVRENTKGINWRDGLKTQNSITIL